MSDLDTPPPEPTALLRILARRASRRRIAGPALGLLAAIGMVSAFVLSIRRPARIPRAPELPSMELPGRGDRVLVLVPHPDDETLACGGLIRRSVRSGADVRVVLVTSGDAFSVVAHRLYPAEPFTPALFVRLGRVRMAETRAALARLGLPPSHVEFLGYPDGGLEKLLSIDWDPRRPLMAYRTQTVHSPYGGPSPSLYCGQSLLNDITARLRTFRPTLLVYPHPGDFNRDHRTLAALTIMALNRLSAMPGWRPPKEATYLVHWGEAWPWPYRSEIGLPLDLPVPMRLAEDRWKQTPLDPPDARNKRDAVLAYRSQFTSRREAGFLEAFARRTEPFSTALRGSGWPNGAAQAEPIESAHSIAFAPALDLTRIRVAADRRYLVVLLSTRRPIAAPAQCRVEIRTLGSDSRWIAGQWPPAPRAPGVWSATATTLEWRLPRRSIGGASRAIVSAATIRGRREGDRTAWALWNLDERSSIDGRSFE